MDFKRDVISKFSIVVFLFGLGAEALSMQNRKEEASRVVGVLKASRRPSLYVGEKNQSFLQALNNDEEVESKELYEILIANDLEEESLEELQAAQDDLQERFIELTYGYGVREAVTEAEAQSQDLDDALASYDEWMSQSLGL